MKLSRWRIILLVIFLTFALSINAYPVSADTAPPPPPFGSNPATGAITTQVQMVSEVVTFDVAASYLNGFGFAKVNAVFKMHNTGTQAESMVARFPLCDYFDGECIWSPAPSIDDLAVGVDGRSVTITTTTETVTTPEIKVLTIPAWGHFNVTFPASQDVIIRVTYTALGYKRDNSSSNLEYNYVLQTGAGWHGLIQQADFIFRLPYDITDKNVEFYLPDNSWTTERHELRWHKEGFKPDDNLRISILDPVIWQSILTESQATGRHPDDGEAWGRLGMAYKKAVWTRRGLLPDPPSLEMTQLSKEAYQNAVRLLPKDPDWHYGYAELLCNIAMWNMDDPAYLSAADPNLIGCIQQLKDTLDLDPKDRQAWSLLRAFAAPDSPWLDDGRWMDVATPGMVDISGTQPDYLILTPRSTSTTEPSGSPTATTEVTVTPSPGPDLRPTTRFPPETITRTAQPAKTAAPPTPLPRITASLSPTPTAASNRSDHPVALAVACLAVLLGLFAIFWLRKSHPNP